MISDSEDRWLLLQSGAGNHAFNMALDEALLTSAPQTNQPILRFYSWTERAASFGYFQNIAEIERATHLRPLVRRPTGGGLVPHDADWTYSVIVPPLHSWYHLRAAESYERVHRWIQSAFARITIPTELAPACRKELPGQCFAGYEKSDVLWFGKKIAGAAQRRTKTGLLIQGSVQPPPGVTRAQWEKAMQEAAQDEWNVQWHTLKLPGALLERAEELARSKYSRDEFNRRR
jgi:lipoate-protein ligase A